ncbi:MAG: hypothetical protein KF841_00650 [Phycisphaerae bacterium]|nr:hypothetical protein [Phycisphaerae bacterium]
MFTRRFSGLAVACFVTAGLGVAALMAMENPQGTQKPATSTPPVPVVQGKEVTLEGRVVDLQCFMSEKFANSDHAKCTADCIKAGVPAAIETKSGLVLIGMGTKSPSAQLFPFALENAKITGKLYDRAGVRYIDMERIEKVTPPMHATANPKTNHSGK